jgi:hypothetical protein
MKRYWIKRSDRRELSWRLRSLERAIKHLAESVEEMAERVAPTTMDRGAILRSKDDDVDNLEDAFS